MDTEFKVQYRAHNALESYESDVGDSRVLMTRAV